MALYLGRDTIFFSKYAYKRVPSICGKGRTSSLLIYTVDENNLQTLCVQGVLLIQINKCADHKSLFLVTFLIGHKNDSYKSHFQSYCNFNSSLPHALILDFSQNAYPLPLNQCSIFTPNLVALALLERLKATWRN